MNYFEDSPAAFLSIRGEHFVLGQQTFSSLRVMLIGLHPIRKRFADGALVCYAPDATRSKTGQHCVFCPTRRDCQRKLRLQLLYLDAGEPLPLLFELNQGSFGGLRELVDTHGLERLQSEILVMSLTIDEHSRRRVEFYLA